MSRKGAASAQRPGEEQIFKPESQPRPASHSHYIMSQASEPPMSQGQGQGAWRQLDPSQQSQEFARLQASAGTEAAMR
jgi:hypothetical protein